MNRLLAVALLALLPAIAFGKGGGHSAAGRSTATHSTKSTVATRNSHGRIARDPKQKAAFVRSCPAAGKTSGGCKGYIVDRIMGSASATQPTFQF